ncbi:hypothetical protein BpHYR1_023152 [Brachionus plicatilis]|uniref:Uncharacterized protein n=1 Tax=Brachionus plicatilis TaxID=10195 RepID=A0A3M7S8W2_BRAPC|nr:hypothetical protein BpHYR1_023152 [Brachionus plicatilis]
MPLANYAHSIGCEIGKKGATKYVALYCKNEEFLFNLFLKFTKPENAIYIKHRIFKIHFLICIKESIIPYRKNI